MRKAILPVFVVAAMGLIGCETNTPNSAASRTELKSHADTGLQQFLAQDSHLQDVINNSVGYVVFPEVGKGAVGIGGASGHGVVYKNGQPSGTVTLTQVSVGPQVGGQTYSELIVFQNEQALNRLMNNSLEFGAAAEATIVKAGAAAAARFDNGVAVYILPKGGLMAGANINGQKFNYSQSNDMGSSSNSSSSSSSSTTTTDTVVR